MDRANIYGAVLAQKSAVTQNVSRENNNIFDGNRIYPGGQSSILAKVVQYCFDTGTVASFKDLNSIVGYIKQNLKYSVLSSFKNTVISASVNDIVIQYSKNCPDDMTKINTTIIKIKRNAIVESAEVDSEEKYSRNVQGTSSTYRMKRNSASATLFEPAFLEHTLSKCKISDMNTVNVKELSKEGKELFKRMVICSSLFEPVIEKLIEEQVINFRQSELNDMFETLNYDVSYENVDTENKGATL